MHNIGEKTVADIKKDFTIVGKQRVHAWYAWAIVGIVFGMALGIVYVANRSAQFSASQAAKYYAPSSNEEGGLDYGIPIAEEADADIDELIIASASDLPPGYTSVPAAPSAGLPPMPGYASCAEQNDWWRANASKLKGFLNRKGAKFPCPSEESDVASAMLFFNSLTKNSAGFASYVPDGKPLGDYIIENVKSIVRNGAECGPFQPAYVEGATGKRNIHLCVKGWFHVMTGISPEKDVYILPSIVHEFGHRKIRGHVICKYGARKGLKGSNCDRELGTTPFTENSSSITNEFYLYSMIAKYYKMTDDFGSGVNGLLRYYRQDAFNSPKSPLEPLKLN